MDVLLLIAMAALGGADRNYMRAEENIGPGGGTVGGTLTLKDDIKLCLGDTTCDWWLVYNVTSTQLELWHTDCDGGGGTDCEVFIFADGGDDLAMTGQLTASDGLNVDSDNKNLTLGAAGATDFKGYFDAIDLRLYTSGSFRFDAPLIGGTYEVKADSGPVWLLNQNCTSAMADGDECSIYIGIDHSPDAYLGITALADGADGVDTFELKVPTYNVDYVVNAGSAALGPTAPTDDTNNHCSGKGFDAVGETVNLKFEIPSCYVDADSSDLTLKIYWCPTGGDAPADTEDVQFDISIRSIVWGTEDADQGTAATGTVTYTQSGAGDDQDTFESEITIDADDANQPINAGDSLSIIFNRDVTNESNSYSGKAIVDKWEIEVPQDQVLCDHQ